MLELLLTWADGLQYRAYCDADGVRLRTVQRMRTEDDIVSIEVLRYVPIGGR
jgi:hypothetical protein